MNDLILTKSVFFKLKKIYIYRENFVPVLDLKPRTLFHKIKGVILCRNFNEFYYTGKCDYLICAYLHFQTDSALVSNGWFSSSNPIV